MIQQFMGFITPGPENTSSREVQVLIDILFQGILSPTAVCMTLISITLTRQIFVQAESRHTNHRLQTWKDTCIFFRTGTTYHALNWPSHTKEKDYHAGWQQFPNK